MSNLEALKGCVSYFDFFPVTILANISPVTGPILNPIPENPQPTTMFGYFGCLSSMWLKSGETWKIWLNYFYFFLFFRSLHFLLIQWDKYRLMNVRVIHFFINYAKIQSQEWSHFVQKNPGFKSILFLNSPYKTDIVGPEQFFVRNQYRNCIYEYQMKGIQSIDGP